MEITLLACMVKREEALVAALGRMQELDVAFPTAGLNEMAERLLAEKPELRLFMGELPEDMAAALAQAMERAEDLIDPEATALDCVNGLARAKLEDRIVALSEAYSGEPEAAREIGRLQKQLAALAQHD